MNFCNPSCSTPLTPFPSIGCDYADYIISGESPYLGFIKCDTVFTDILDPAEWAAKKAAGDVLILPVGKVVISPKAVGETRRVGCKTVVKTTTKEFSYETPIVDTENDTEAAIWTAVENNKNSLLPFFILCDGSILIQNGAATGTTIGFEVSNLLIDSNNEDGGENANYIYTVSGTITDRRIFKRVKLSAALLAAITA